MRCMRCGKVRGMMDTLLSCPVLFYEAMECVLTLQGYGGTDSDLGVNRFRSYIIYNSKNAFVLLQHTSDPDTVYCI